MKQKVSVLIPVYNEGRIIAQNTEKIINFLKKKNMEFEILICSNGSTDSTAEKGRQLERKFKGKVRFFSFSEKGVGRAFKKNVLEAKYNNLVSVDMDIPVNLSFIELFVKLLEKYDIIIGSKKIGRQKRPLVRIFVSSMFLLLARGLLGIHCTDYSLSAKAFKKETIIKYLNRIDCGSFYTVDIIYLAKKDGCGIKEISVSCEDRRSSKFNLFYEIFYYFTKLSLLTLREKL